MTDYRMLCSSPGCTNIAEVIVGDETPAGSVGRQHLYCPEHEVRETTNEPRAVVQAFALAMERKLAANDGGKGNWHDDGEWNHLLYAEAEMDELKQAMADYRNALATMFQRAIFPDENAAEKQRAAVETAMQRVNDLKQAVLDEAADVANYLMFACDVIGALPPTDERGR